MYVCLRVYVSVGVLVTYPAIGGAVVTSDTQGGRATTPGEATARGELVTCGDKTRRNESSV